MGQNSIKKTVKQFLFDNNIIHHLSSPEKHQANGRIERFHRTLRQYLRKYNLIENLNQDKIQQAIYEAIEAYNNTKHRVTGMSPNEAWNNPTDEKLKISNSSNVENKYLKEFSLCYRQKFNKDDNVAVEISTIDKQDKLNPRYIKNGKIIDVLDNDSYLIHTEDSKIIKRSHSQITKL